MIKRVGILILVNLINSVLLSQKINLKIPSVNLCSQDTFKILNQSEMAYSHYWTFCNKSSILNLPVAKQLSHFNNQLDDCAMAEPVFDGMDYYVFITNYANSKIVKAKYGNSLNNTPTITNLGNIGGKLPIQLEGIEIKKEGNNWVGFVTGSNKIVRIEFGANLDNNSLNAVDLGNLGLLSWPHELHIFYHDTTWVGFVANRNNNSISRLNFGNSLFNTPTATNFTGIGLTGGGSGIEVKMDKKNDFYAFVTDVTGKRIVRLAFGKNIASNNSPTVTQFNNLANAQVIARGIIILKGCGGEQIGYVSDEQNRIIKIEFPNDLGGNIVATNLGSFNNLVGKSNDISDIIIENDVMYFYSCDPLNNTLTRFAINVCGGVPQFKSQITKEPLGIVYKDTGTYIINYIMNPGEANQKDTCFNIHISQNCCKSSIENKNLLCSQTFDSIKASYTPINAQIKWMHKNLNISSLPNILPLDTGSYKFIVSSVQFGCRDTNEVIIKKDTQKIYINKNITLCNKDTAQLNIFNVNNCTWSPNAFITNINDLSPKVFPPQKIVYYVKSMTLAGCIFNDSLTIDKGNFKLKINNDTSICFGDSILIKPLFFYKTYLWNTGDTSAFIVGKVNNTYSLITHDSMGCIDRDTMFLNAIVLPNLNLGNDTTVCANLLPILSANKGFQTYLWNNSDTTRTLQVKGKGSYSVKASIGKCLSMDSIEINAFSLPKLWIGNDTNICENTSINIGANQLFSSYLWAHGEKIRIITIANRGIYILKVTDSNNCQIADTLFLSTTPNPRLQLSTDFFPCAKSFTIKSSVNTSVLYLWNNGLQTPNLTIQNFNSIQSVVYNLKVSNKCGSDFDSLIFTPCLKPEFYIPNAFSPQDDAINDVFKISGLNIKEIKMQIFNRWGEKIFEAIGQEPVWDGKYNNQPCMEGVYLFVLTIKGNNGITQFKNGTFTILR